MGSPPTDSRESDDEYRPFYDALTPTGARPVRGPSLGFADPAVGRRARLCRSLDRRASHRPLGASSFARSLDRAGADGDPADPPRPRRVLLPYHHPAELANRVAMLDHMAQGRLNFGVAASGLPSDWAMFNVDGNSGQHREMTREALDIILKLWTAEEPFDYPGKYWKVTKTDLMLRTLRPHIRPLQKPYPPIGVAGVSKGSETLKLAGEHGFLPMSLNLNPGYVASHWEFGRGGSAPHRAQPASRRLAPGARDLRRRERCRGLAAFGRGNDGPDDARIFPAAADRCRRHPISKT